MLPGYQSVTDPEVRARFEKAWGVTLPRTTGTDNHEMVDAIRDGQLKAMYLFGEEMSLVDSNANYVEEQFSKLEFFVVQDIFFTHTCQFADVILPAAPSLEKEGLSRARNDGFSDFTKSWSCYREVVLTGRIIQELANRMNAGWNYRHPSEVMDEMASLTPLYAGVSYERLEGYRSLQWPVAEDGTDQPLLYTQQFAFPDGMARLYPIGWTVPTEQPDAEYDLHLNNGNLLEHFHSGNLTYRVPWIKTKTPDVLWKSLRNWLESEVFRVARWWN